MLYCERSLLYLSTRVLDISSNKYNRIKIDGSSFYFLSRAVGNNLADYYLNISGIRMYLLTKLIILRNPNLSLFSKKICDWLESGK
jgi:hypothetical protein